MYDGACMIMHACLCFMLKYYMYTVYIFVLHVTCFVFGYDINIAFNGILTTNIHLNDSLKASSFLLNNVETLD